MPCRFRRGGRRGLSGFGAHLIAPQLVESSQAGGQSRVLRIGGRILVLGATGAAS